MFEGIWGSIGQGGFGGSKYNGTGKNFLAWEGFSPGQPSHPSSGGYLVFFVKRKRFQLRLQCVPGIGLSQPSMKA